MLAASAKRIGSSVRVHRDEPGSLLATHQNVVLGGTRQPPTVDSVERLAAKAEELARDYPEGLNLVVALRAPRPKLDPRVTKSILAAWTDLEPLLRCSVVWISAGGFRGTIQRSLVTSVLMIRSTKIPSTVVPSGWAAASFIARHDPAHAKGPDALSRALGEFDDLLTREVR